MGLPALPVRLAAAALLGALLLPGSAGAADRTATPAPRKTTPVQTRSQTPSRTAPAGPAKKMIKLCRPEVRTIGPLGCYQPGTSLVTLYGSCLGGEPGTQRLLLEVGGTSSVIRHKTWEDGAVSFTMPRGGRLTPGATGFVGVADAAKKIVAQKQPFAICQEATGTMMTPAAPGGLEGDSPAKKVRAAEPLRTGANQPVMTMQQSLKTATPELPSARSLQPHAITRPGVARSIPDTSKYRMLPGDETKPSSDGGEVQWHAGVGRKARATYITGFGFVEASGGIALRGDELDVVSVDASVSCPEGQAVTSVAVHSLGGTSNTLNWPYADGNQTVDVSFEKTRLLSPASVPALGICPSEPLFSTVNRDLDFFFVFFCQGPDGSPPIGEQHVGFSVPVELKCYRESGFRAAVKTVKFRHQCPTGYLTRSTGQSFWEGPAGWADPQVCVKTP